MATVILAGDFINKGNKTRETIDFIYKNLDNIKLVCGNHERYIYNYFSGKFPIKNNNEAFTSIDFFTKNPDYLSKFNEIYDKCTPFLKFESLVNYMNPFYVTHSPCPNKYLGKLDPKSISAQIKYLQFGEYKDSFLKLVENTEYGLPYHIFGHITFERNIFVKNYIGIDTGCIHGKTLTGVFPQQSKPFYVSQKFLK